ncbi:MAG TPA: hypothetical protein VFQ70_02710 [Candidatus Saccharimonadaceae bacterium]|nr:hypothetical protein [Candidatus Saccharimonadaceae bacterium]
MRQQRGERGVVSIFIVIFAAIFMVVITVSFLLVMMRDQQQATQYNLSQNAYDSAMAGVSDAERAIALCASNPNHAGCNQINGGGCQTLGNPRLGLGVTFSDVNGNEEYPIQTTMGGNNPLNQAYTCVTINTQPNDYQANVSAGTPLIIPLQATAQATLLNFSWKSENSSATPSYPKSPTQTGLLNFKAWSQPSTNYPPVMQLELIRLGPGGTVTLSDLDGQSAKTLLLYPMKGLASRSSLNFSTYSRLQPSQLQAVNCYDDPNDGNQCYATLSDGGNPMVSTSGAPSVYLVMMPIYRDAAVTVGFPQPSSNSFENLQAVVDSTGRANDLFRRVQARVDIIPHPTTYPNAAVSLQGPLCKDFTVTPSGVQNNTCTW